MAKPAPECEKAQRPAGFWREFCRNGGGKCMSWGQQGFQWWFSGDTLKWCWNPRRCWDYGSVRRTSIGTRPSKHWDATTCRNDMEGLSWLGWVIYQLYKPIHGPQKSSKRNRFRYVYLHYKYSIHTPISLLTSCIFCHLLCACELPWVTVIAHGHESIYCSSSLAPFASLCQQAQLISWGKLFRRSAVEIATSSFDYERTSDQGGSTRSLQTVGKYGAFVCPILVPLWNRDPLSI